MRLLTVQIGPHNIALPADTVVSVARGKAGLGPEKRQLIGPGPKNAARLDLAETLHCAKLETESRPVISCIIDGRSFELLVDRILSLENFDEAAIHPWPGLLRFVDNFQGVATAGARIFLIIDITTIPRHKKVPRK